MSSEYTNRLDLMAACGRVIEENRMGQLQFVVGKFVVWWHVFDELDGMGEVNIRWLDELGEDANGLMESNRELLRLEWLLFLVLAISRTL